MKSYYEYYTQEVREKIIVNVNNFNKRYPGSIKEPLFFANEFIKAAEKENPNVPLDDIFIQSLLHEIVIYDEKIYRLSEEFANHLHRTNLRISSDYLPNVDCICIEIPECLDMVYERNSKIKMAIVSLLPFEDEKDVRVFRAFLVSKIDDNHYVDVAATLLIKKDQDLEESINDRCKYLSENKKVIQKDITKFILKCILYINTGNPDLRELRPPRKPLTRKPKELRRWEKENADKPLIPITLVGYDFKKPKLYLVDKTWVTGHFRWQPYGEKRSLIKLIWIDPHERQYKEDEPSD